MSHYVGREQVVQIVSVKPLTLKGLNEQKWEFEWSIYCQLTVHVL